MIPSAADRLGLVEPWLASEELLAPAAFARLRRLSDAVPPIFALTCVEVRLTDDPQADLLVGATHTDSCRNTLATDTAPELDAASCAGPILRAWAGGVSPVSRSPLLWIEYDLPPERDTPIALAGVCVNGAQFGGRSYSAEEQLGIAADGIGVSDCRGISPRDLACLSRAARSLSFPETLLYVASLAPRGRKALRLVAFVEVSRVGDLLASIHWPGDDAARRLLREVLVPEWEWVGIQLEIADGEFTPYVAVELYVKDEPQRMNVARRFSSESAKRGWCMESKSRAALGWLGTDSVACTGAWPMRIGRGLILKLTPNGAAAPGIKAYLGFQYERQLFRDPSPLA